MPDFNLSVFTGPFVFLRNIRLVSFRFGKNHIGIFLSIRTFHNWKSRSNTIRNTRGFYQIASGKTIQNPYNKYSL